MSLTILKQDVIIHRGCNMENKKIILILILIIVVLSCVLGAMVFQSLAAKEPVKIKILSNRTLYEGDNFIVRVTDLNNTAISNENVNIEITDSNGNVVFNQTVKTNSKGKATLGLDLKKGKYVVNVTYGGNEKYAGNSNAKKLTVKKATTESVSENKEDTNSYPGYSPYFGSYRTIETQQELVLIETANGEYYVFAGDGAHTFAGYDSNGHIQLGSYVGKY